MGFCGWMCGLALVGTREIPVVFLFVPGCGLPKIWRGVVGFRAGCGLRAILRDWEPRVVDEMQEGIQMTFWQKQGS